MTSGGASRPVIVAGVDGSDDSKAALRWAARQARLTGAEVHAVIGWQVPLPGHHRLPHHHLTRETTRRRQGAAPDRNLK